MSDLPMENSSPSGHASRSAWVSSGWAPGLALAGLLLIAASVYWPGLSGGFAFDDYPNITSNAALHVSTLRWPDWLAAVFSSPASSLQRPLAMFTFAVNHYFTGLDPWPMKLTNLSIHLLNTLLVFALVDCLFQQARPSSLDGRKNKWPALMVAAAWALNPINLMAVLFVVQRMESLCHTFVFAGLWLYALGRQRQQRGDNGWPLVFGGLIAGTLLGLLAKESAALLPAYAFCLELCLFHFRGEGERQDRRVFALFLAVLWLPAIAGLFWLQPMFLGPKAYAAREFNLFERLLTESRVVLDYLRWTLLPDLRQMGLYHDDYAISRGFFDPPGTLFALIAIPVLLFVAWLGRRRYPLACLGLLWFFAAQLLTATVIPFELMFEHRNYFASLGICIALVDLLLHSTNSAAGRRAGALVLALMLVLYAGGTNLRAREWSSPTRFAMSEASKHPDSPRATYDLARTMIILTDFNRDSPLLARTNQAIEQALQAPGSNVLPEQAALIFSARTGAPLNPAWWSDMQNKLRRHPIGPQETTALAALVDCAIAGNCKFPRQDMLDTFAAALSQGDNPEVLNIYGNYVLNVMRDSNLALKSWQQAVRLRPDEPQYRIALIKLLSALGREQDARAQISILRKLGRLGQYGGTADSLDKRVERDRLARMKPPAAPAHE